MAFTTRRAAALACRFLPCHVFVHGEAITNFFEGPAENQLILDALGLFGFIAVVEHTLYRSPHAAYTQGELRRGAIVVFEQAQSARAAVGARRIFIGRRVLYIQPSRSLVTRPLMYRPPVPAQGQQPLLLLPLSPPPTLGELEAKALKNLKQTAEDVALKALDKDGDTYSVLEVVAVAELPPSFAAPLSEVLRTPNGERVRLSRANLTEVGETLSGRVPFGVGVSFVRALAVAL